MAQIPITYSEILNLTTAPLSIPLENIKFGSCSMESDKFITVCETGQSQLVIVNLSAGSTVTCQKSSAEAAIMNTFSNVIAVKAGQILQIFDLELKAKIKIHNMPAPVTFWRWVSPTSIALVTASSVFHWSIEGDTAPVQIFDRNPALTDSQIINYQVSDDGKWCLLCGISACTSSGVVNGNIQLYSIEKSLSQMLQGHTGVFSAINLPGREEPAQVLIFEDKKPDRPAKLFIKEVGRDKTAPGGVFCVSPQLIPTAPEAPNDFPVTMNASKQHGMVYMISKMGYLFLFDIFSGKLVYHTRLTTDTVFSAVEHSASGGIRAITRKGLVLQISLNESTLLPYIVGQLRDQQLAIDIASRLNLSGAEEIYPYKKYDRCWETIIPNRFPSQRVASPTSISYPAAIVLFVRIGGWFGADSVLVDILEEYLHSLSVRLQKEGEDGHGVARERSAMDCIRSYLHSAGEPLPLSTRVVVCVFPNSDVHIKSKHLIQWTFRSHLEGFCGFSGPLYWIVRLESAGFEAHSLMYRVTRDVGAGRFNQVLKAWDN